MIRIEKIKIDGSAKEYSVRVNAVHLDRNGLMKPSAYLELACVVVDMVHDDCGMSLAELVHGGFSWILSGVNIKISRPVEFHSALKAVTWLEGTYGPYCHRLIDFYDGSGLLFTAAFYSLFFDLKKRAIVMDGFPFELSSRHNRSKDASPPRIIFPSETYGAVKRSITHSDVDCVGHCNNTRYAAFCYDLFSHDELKNYRLLKEFTILFRREISDGQCLDMTRCAHENQCFFRGAGDDGKTNFEAVFYF